MKNHASRVGGQSVRRSPNKNNELRRSSAKSKNLLVLAGNLLPWYNELNDALEVEDNRFPSDIKEKIKAFGEYDIESISHKQTTLTRKKKLIEETNEMEQKVEGEQNDEKEQLNENQEMNDS